MGAGPDHPAGPPPPRHRSRRRRAVRPEPYRHDGSPLAAFLYLCAALGAAVLLWLSKIPPPPSYSSLQGYRGLFRRHPPRLAEQELSDGPTQILAATAPQLKQPLLALTGSILDADRVAAAIRSFIANITCRSLAVSPPQPDSSDSDDGAGSSSNGDEVTNCWYTPIHLLDAGGARLIVPGFIQQLHEMMLRGLPESVAVESLRRAFRDAKISDVFCYRLFDVVESQCDICADPHGLTDRATGTLVMTMKITAKLLHMIWFELHGQNWQLCQEVKRECFWEIAGQSVEKLLDVALSLSNERWSADQPLPILDALVDSLYNIIELPLNKTELISNEVAGMLDQPLNRYEPVHNMVAHIFCKMVIDFRGILEATTSDKHINRESTIHPATVIFVRYLEFFHRNGEMMQSVLGTGDCGVELTLICSWVSKLGRDAAKVFPVKGQGYIFVLNNIFYVYQMKYHPGGFLSHIELQSLRSLINQYIKTYIEECWVPIVRYLDVDSLKMPCRSSLDNFLEEFFSICSIQMTWKVRTKLKKILREELVKLILPKYENFLTVLPEGNSGPCWSKGMWRARPEKPTYTAPRLEGVIRGFFEG